MSAVSEPQLIEFHREDTNVISFIRKYCSTLCRGLISDEHFTDSFVNFTIGYALISTTSNDQVDDILHGFIVSYIPRDKNGNEIDVGTLNISTLCTESRHGYGEQLLKCIFKYARSNGYWIVKLVALHIKEVVDFYERNGFEFQNKEGGDPEQENDGTKDMEGVPMFKIL